MKIELDKALLWLLPYLYFVASLYYWGYWSYFNVDPFGYIQTTDLVKGVAAPLLVSLLQAIAIGLVGMSYQFILSKFKSITKFSSKLSNKQGLFITGFLIVVLVLVFRIPEPERSYLNYGDVNSGKLRIVAGFFIVISFAVAYFINKLFPKISDYKTSVRFFVIMFIVLLLPNAFLEGCYNALLVVENKSFLYTVTDSLYKSKKTLYKFLGKTGDYYILTAIDNSRYVAVPTSKMEPFVLEYYSIKDDTSKKRFRNNIKQANVVVGW